MGSIDREKVIRGLECCIEKLDTVVNLTHGFNCTACPYYQQCEAINSLVGLPLAKEALALIKGAADLRRDAIIGVRVMTADDMATCLTGDVILLEDRATGSVINAIMCQKVSHADDDTIYTEAIEVVTAYTVGSAWLRCDYYNRTWRCWTSRPTVAQREATPWEA